MNKLHKEINKMRPESLQDLIEDAKDYALYKGIAQRDSKLSKDARIHLPFCLIPCEFPIRLFQHVHNVQPWLNFVLHKISNNRDFLRHCLTTTIAHDDFIRKIFDIYEEVYDCQSEQASLGLIRSDYLIQKGYGETDERGIKQVENNTIAAGLGGVAPLLRDLYKFVLGKLKFKYYSCSLPENNSCLGLVTGLITAYNFYDREGAIILFVVEEETFNISDQRILEYKLIDLIKGANVEVLRCTFKYLRHHLLLRDRILFVDGKEVAVVYYRVGYAPEHYEEPEDWTTRLQIEKSIAVKCPTVGLHLAGTKKVQAVLTEPGVLDAFLDPIATNQLRKLFARQMCLDVEVPSFVSSAVFDPDQYVLKPEREGGGNNMYGWEMTKFLLRDKDEGRAESKGHILMQKIDSPEVPNFIIRSDSTHEACNVNSELGIFGVIFGTRTQVFKNEAVGHLLRCKPSKNNEGGIATGAGALSYPFLMNRYLAVSTYK